jgi:hypothetical protein
MHGLIRHGCVNLCGLCCDRAQVELDDDDQVGGGGGHDGKEQGVVDGEEVTAS